MYFDDIKLNTTVEIAPVQIEKEKMMAFARLFEPIPLHVDEEYAKNTVFGDIIAPGAFSCMTVWEKYLENDLVGKDLLAGKSRKMEFFHPVYAGDILQGRAEVTKLTPRNEKNGIVELTIHAYNQKGQLVFTNVVEVIAKRELSKA